MINQMRNAASRFLGRSMSVKPEIQLPLMRLGTSYGGWSLHGDTLGAESIVYSIGTGNDISFDSAIIAGFGCQVHAFDGSSISQQWVARQQTPPGWHFHATAVADYDGEMLLYPLEQPGNVNHTLLVRPHLAAHAYRTPCLRLGSLMKKFGHGHIDVLKMDIEGAEYPVLADMLEARLDVRQILVEFHHRFPEVGVARTRHALQGLRSAGYRIIATTEGAREVSFIRL